MLDLCDFYFLFLLIFIFIYCFLIFNFNFYLFTSFTAVLVAYGSSLDQESTYTVYAATQGFLTHCVWARDQTGTATETMPYP